MYSRTLLCVNERTCFNVSLLRADCYTRLVDVESVEELL